MRSNLRILVAAAAALLVAPVAMADNVEDQLKLMNERMMQMEDQLQATQDELDASKDQVDRQADVMEKAGLERQGQSGLSSFYQSVEISGWIAGSWFWNFNNPSEQGLEGQNLSLVGNSVNGGRGNGFYPFHPDHNSFSVDQLWFEMQKPATEESRAGFRADFVYGKTAGLLSTGTNRALGFIDVDDFSVAGDDASDFNLYQAYIEYLTPWGPNVKVGKFATWLGAEVVPTVYNLNITRGIAFSLNQPINHYGVSVEGQNAGIDWGLAVVNDGNGISPDNNNAKHLMAKVGYAQEMWSAQVALLYGNDEPGDTCYSQSNGGGSGDALECSSGIVDLLITVDPMENFTAYLNYDYGWRGAESSRGQEEHTISLAGRYGFTDRLGFAMRAEYAVDSYNSFGLNFNDAEDGDTEIWGITGTVDYTITDNLMLKAELRYDYATNNPNGTGPTNIFVSSQNGDTQDDLNLGNSDWFSRRDQLVGGFELVYQF